MTRSMTFVGEQVATVVVAVGLLWLPTPSHAKPPAGQPPAVERNIEEALERIKAAKEDINAAVATAELEPELANNIVAMVSELDTAVLELETALLMSRLRAALAASERQAEAESGSAGLVSGMPTAPTNRESTDLEWEAARRELSELEAALTEAERAVSSSEESEGSVAAFSTPDTLTDSEWEAAIPTATRYGRPDRTSEGNLDDGSHYEQSSDDRSYREFCDGSLGRPGIAGFNMSVRGNTESLHWRWKTSTGTPAAGRAWRVYFNGNSLGGLGEQIVRVADTEMAWYQYEPARNREERRFILLIACESPGVEEIEIHYHH